MFVTEKGRNYVLEKAVLKIEMTLRGTRKFRVRVSKSID